MATLLFLITAGISTTFADEKGEAEEGKEIYDHLCDGCHGNAGKGDGPAGARLPVKPANLTDGKRMKTLSDQYLFDIIKNGGRSVGKSPIMRPFGSKLNDEDIRDVIAYIRTLAKSNK